MKTNARIVLIAALSKNHVIGLDNRLPWRLAADWDHFKQVTAGYPMIMGRTSAESEDALYSDTQNVILTRRASVEIPFDHDVAHSFQQAFTLLHPYPTIFVIGGEKVFKEAVSFADEMILTHIDLECEGDTFFPQFVEEEWQKTVLMVQKADAHNSHPFEIVRWIRR